ncbi:hypothetical protein H0H92_000119 [Tricholoma furcatifolium]|nr:hypothetical protein H0H92_000119 [Tricholoma furcatifolium]
MPSNAPHPQFRRPWSPEPFNAAEHTQSIASTPQPRHREVSDASVEALDLADYSRTLQIRQEDRFPSSPPHPRTSLDTLPQPSLVSRNGTLSTNLHSRSSQSHRPFSVPPPSQHFGATSHRPTDSLYGLEARTQAYESEIDITRFPAWSRNWYNTNGSVVGPTSLPDIYTPIPTSYLNPKFKRSPFDLGQLHPTSEDLSSDPNAFTPAPSYGHESTRDLLPWGPDPVNAGPIDSNLKEERMRMLEREFGPKAKDKGFIETDDGQILDENGVPVIGTVDAKGNLVTQGPKKRAALRVLQILLTLAAGGPSIYAAVAIKPTETPPPAGKAPSYVLYIFSAFSFLLLSYLFIFRSCCCMGKRQKGINTPFSNGMMVLPIQGLTNGKKGQKSKTGKKQQAANGGDVQVNLIVDPEAFGRHEDDNSEEEEDDDDWNGSIPGGYNSGRKKRRRRPRRRGVLAGLAMEQKWKVARAWLKRLTILDIALLFAWGAVFVFILIGKRCPIGGYDGWCNAYNVSSAASCLLSFAFGLNTFFDIKDLSDSKNADIEALILSGEFFNGPERSSSPTRSPSPDSGWHEQERSEEAKRKEAQGLDYDSDEERRDILKARKDYGESIGMGPGRTGVKGVIRDRDESERLSREKRDRELDEVRKRMEKSNLGGKTFLEEEREKGLDEKVDEIVFREREAAAAERKTDVFGRVREGRFGHLREVGAKGFLNGIENEDRGTWVVVHLYDSSLERCYVVDGTLARLARLYPDTKFLRVRAAALGFAKKRSSQSHSSRSRRRKAYDDDDDDDDDPYGEKEDEDSDGGDDDDEVDLDMLPTMLVYRDGELVHNWVRVDWEAGPAGIDELLDRHHILPRTESILGASSNLSLPSDDEDDFDLLWSDDDVDHDI